MFQPSHKLLQQYSKLLEKLPSKKAFIVLGNNSQVQLKLISDLLKNNCQQISIREHQKTISKHISIPQIIHIRYENQNKEQQEACIISISYEKQVLNRIFNKIMCNYLTKKFQTIHLVLVFQAYYDDVNLLNENINQLVSFYRSSIQIFLQSKHQKCISAILMDPNLREGFSEIQQFSDSKQIQQLIANINKSTAYQFTQGDEEILFQQIIKNNQQLIQTSLLINTVYLEKNLGQNLVDLVEISVKQFANCLQIKLTYQVVQLINKFIQTISNKNKLQLVVTQFKEQYTKLLPKMQKNQINQKNFQIINQILEYILLVCLSVNIENTPDQKAILQILSQQLRNIKQKIGNQIKIQPPTKFPEQQMIKLQTPNTQDQQIMSSVISAKRQKIFLKKIPQPPNANQKKSELGLNHMKFDIKTYNSLLQSYTPIIRNDEKFCLILNLPNRIFKFDLLHRSLVEYRQPLKNRQELKIILFYISKILRNYKLFQSSIKVLMIIPDFNGIQRDFDSAAEMDMQAILNDRHQRCLSISFVKILQSFCEQNLRRNIAVKCNNYLLAIGTKQQKIGRFAMDNDDEFLRKYKEKPYAERYMNFNYHPNIKVKSDSFREQILKKVFLLEKSDIDIPKYYTEKQQK